MTLILVQGDQYNVPVQVTLNGTVITPDNSTDVRIQMGDTLYSYADNELTYDSDAKAYLFPLTEEQTRNMGKAAFFQVGVKQGTDISYSPEEIITIEQSIITEAWDDDGE